MPNADIFGDARRRCEDLAMLVSGGRFPIRMRNLAEKREVAEVWFQRLLGDGVLAKARNRYAIGIHADPEDRKKCEERYAQGEMTGLLPVRQRFAFAHEIAHTLFYELEDEELVKGAKIAGGGGKTRQEILERHCDDLARMLLLPEELLLPRLTSRFFTTPDLVRHLVREAGVSPEVLLRRVESLADKISVPQPGALVVIQRSPEGWRILRNLPVGRFSLRTITTQRRKDLIEVWFKSPQSRLFGGPEQETEFTLPIRTSSSTGVRHCRLVTESVVPSHPSATTVIAVIDTGQDTWDA